MKKKTRNIPNSAHENSLHELSKMNDEMKEEEGKKQTRERVEYRIYGTCYCNGIVCAVQWACWDLLLLLVSRAMRICAFSSLFSFIFNCSFESYVFCHILCEFLVFLITILLAFYLTRETPALSYVLGIPNSIVLTWWCCERQSHCKWFYRDRAYIFINSFSFVFRFCFSPLSLAQFVSGDGKFKC